MLRTKKTRWNTRKTTRGALIAALYVLFTYLSFLFGLSSGAIQCRLSEALCILPLFMPEAVPGLFLGCILANLLTGATLYDVVFGAAATLLGAAVLLALSKKLRKMKIGILFATLPNILANALIIPPIAAAEFGAEEGYFAILLGVVIGEVVAGGVLGVLLAFGLQKTRLFKDETS